MQTFSGTLAWVAMLALAACDAAEPKAGGDATAADDVTVSGDTGDASSTGDTGATGATDATSPAPDATATTTDSAGDDVATPTDTAPDVATEDAADVVPDVASDAAAEDAADALVDDVADAAVDDTTPPSDVVEPPPGTLFFATDVLHQVEITVAARDLDTLDNDLSVRVPCDVRYDGELVLQAGCKKKGQSTLRPLDDKPSFNIKLDDTVVGADIDGVQRFALNNTIRDPTFTSEPLTYLLYNRAGVVAPRTAHAVVRFNGEVKGIYVVVEGVNKRFLRAAYGDGTGNLYEGPWDFTHDIGGIELKDEDEGRTRDDLTALVDAIAQADDDALVSAITPHLDLDQTLRMMAVDMAFCLWDGYTIAAWNFYLYHVPGGRFVWVPHGADWPYYVSDIDPFEPDFRPWGAEFPAGILAIRLLRSESAAAYRTALSAVVDSAFDVAVLSDHIDTIATVVRSADTSIPVLAGAVADFDDHLDEPRDFVTDRHAFLVDALAR